MKFQNVIIESLAYALPEEIWTSDSLETKLTTLYNRLKLPFGRLELMTGIRERRFWNADFKASQSSTLAGENVLRKSQINREDIDLLIHSSVCRDRLEPSTAAYVHHNLKLSSKTQILDVSNACLGFLNAMILAAGLIESQQISTALIVSGENGRHLIDWTLNELNSKNLSRNEIKPFFANLTIGAGSVAVVLSHKSKNSGLQLKYATVSTDSQASTLCQGGNTGSNLEMQTDSEQLLEAGISLAQLNWRHFKEISNWTEDTPHRIICHQVGKQHRNRLYSALKLDLAKDFSTFEILGNIGSVSLPLSLSMSLDSKKAQPNEKIALLGIGSGLSSMMVGLEA